jgi:hypothetical protein
VTARRLTSLLAACGILAASGAQAHCSATSDEQAFDVSALKSELSVLAVACGDDTDYNAFIEHSRGELVREDGVVNAWFKKNYGRAAQAKYDSYITLQANEQGLSGQHEGSDFCPRLKPVFAEAMAVPVASLPEYAAAKNMMPVDVACTSIAENAAVATPARGRAAPRRATTKK